MTVEEDVETLEVAVLEEKEAMKPHEVEAVPNYLESRLFLLELLV